MWEFFSKEKLNENERNVNDELKREKKIIL